MILEYLKSVMTSRNLPEEIADDIMFDVEEQIVEVIMSEVTSLDIDKWAYYVYKNVKAGNWATVSALDEIGPYTLFSDLKDADDVINILRDEVVCVDNLEEYFNENY